MGEGGGELSWSEGGVEPQLEEGWVGRKLEGPQKMWEGSVGRMEAG